MDLQHQPVHTPRSTRALRTVASVCLVALAFAGCSGSDAASGEDAGGTQSEQSSPVLAFSEDNADAETSVEAKTQAEANPAPLVLSRTLDDAEIKLVEFEISWMCDAQQQVFASTEAIAKERDDRLRTSEIDATDYADFRVAIDADDDLRKAILRGYRQDCQPS